MFGRIAEVYIHDDDIIPLTIEKSCAECLPQPEIEHMVQDINVVFALSKGIREITRGIGAAVVDDVELPEVFIAQRLRIVP
jgi:hypothetical protein